MLCSLYCIRIDLLWNLFLGRLDWRFFVLFCFATWTTNSSSFFCQDLSKSCRAVPCVDLLFHGYRIAIELRHHQKMIAIVYHSHTHVLYYNILYCRIIVWRQDLADTRLDWEWNFDAHTIQFIINWQYSNTALFLFSIFAAELKLHSTVRTRRKKWTFHYDQCCYEYWIYEDTTIQQDQSSH